MSAKTQNRSGGGRKLADRPRIVYFDVMRAFAPIAVVLLHILLPFAENRDYVGTDGLGHFWQHAIAASMRWAVPIFIMMSGALFLNPNRNFSYKKHYRKYVLRLVLAYLVWQVVYSLGVLFLSEGLFEDRLEYAIKVLCGDHYTHLWFLVMLIAMYILVPILRKITESKVLTEYFLFIGIIGCFALPIIANYCRMLMKASSGTNPVVLGSLGGVVGGIDYFAGKLDLRYIVYFVLGYYLATEHFSRRLRWVIYCLGVGGLAVMIFASPLSQALIGMSLDFESGTADGQNINFLVLLFSVAVFLFVRSRSKNIDDVPKPIAFMAKHSFGVYLVHYFLVEFVLYRFIFRGQIVLGNMYLVPIFTVAVYLCSLGIAWTLSKIPLVRKVV